MSGTPYRCAAAPGPIEDGEYDDFGQMLRAVCRAVRRLQEPVWSADHPKRRRVGFEVGSYRWEIRLTRATRTCPEHLWGHLRTGAGRLRLAQLMTVRELGPRCST